MPIRNMVYYLFYECQVGYLYSKAFDFLVTYHILVLLKQIFPTSQGMEWIPL